MKICPRCQKTYADDNLNFCLEDGSVLAQATAEPPQTVMVNQPVTTQPQPQPPSQPGAQTGWNTPQQYAAHQQGQPQKKSSKAWIWVLLILGVVVLVCGGGFVGLIFWGASQADKTANFSTSNDSRTPAGNKAANTSTTTSTSTSGRNDVETIPLSIFVKEFSIYGTTELNGLDLTMGSKEKGYYYVLVAPDQYRTDDADTRVTLRNINNASGSLGYGLIFHSNPTPLQQDYAFLIDTKRKRYRVVHHEPQKETSVVAWTTSTAIKEGTEENTLEARDLDDKIELYINGTMVTSIKNIYGYVGGVPGIYSGDGVKITFKNLEIRK
jgi:hypothetical protein